MIEGLTRSKVLAANSQLPTDLSRNSRLNNGKELKEVHDRRTRLMPEAFPESLSSPQARSTRGVMLGWSDLTQALRTFFSEMTKFGHAVVYAID